MTTDDNTAIINYLRDSVFTFHLYKYMIGECGHDAYSFQNRPVSVVSDIMEQQLKYIPFKLCKHYDEDISIYLISQFYESSVIIVEYNLCIDTIADLNRIKIANPDFFERNLEWRIRSMLTYHKKSES